MPGSKLFPLIGLLFAARFLSAQSPSNPELTKLFDADQASRSEVDHSSRPAYVTDWTKLRAEDAKRRVQVNRMLEDGQIRSAEDYVHASFIFQHGLQPEDYLKAHLLAVQAVALGSIEGRWISAATLDRYLQAIGQQQVYGTQFKTVGGKWTQPPVAIAGVSDSMREALCVVPIAEQRRILEDVQAGKPFRSTHLKICEEGVK